MIHKTDFNLFVKSFAILQIDNIIHSQQIFFFFFFLLYKLKHKIYKNKKFDFMFNMKMLLIWPINDAKHNILNEIKIRSVDTSFQFQWRAI